MHENERHKLKELTEKAVAINKKLLTLEEKFLENLSSGADPSSLATANEELNELCLKEHLTLAAAKSLLQIVNKNDDSLIEVS